MGAWAAVVVLPPKEGTNSGTLGLRLGFSAVAVVAELRPDEGETTPSTTMGHLVGSILDRNCKKKKYKKNTFYSILQRKAQKKMLFLQLA